MARFDSLISPLAMLKNSTFLLNEMEWTIGKNLSQWSLGSHPGRVPQFASIKFLPSVHQLFGLCDINITQPSLFVKLVYWPQHGHTLFNVISNIYQTMKEIKVEFGRIRLYAAVDDVNAINDWNEKVSDLGQYTPIFKAFSNEPVYNYYGLIKDSLSQTICFTKTIAIGVSKRLDHYTVGISLQDWRSFSKWVLDVFQIPTTTMKSDTKSSSERVVLTLIARSSRKILNLSQLKSISEKTYKRSMFAQIIDLAGISFADQLRYMRNTTILFAIDGTALVNSLFMLNPCGVVIHIGTYMMRVLVPGKGKNFRPLVEAGTGKNRYIYSEIQRLIDVHDVQRNRLRNISLFKMTPSQRFRLAVQQDVRLPLPQYLKLLKEAMNMVQLCFNRLPGNINP
ncbi:unnamed protein product [Rotaria socialis]|uniref:Glycosyltransferase 61 catalytic domain-containing protein n=1 Tax=Rotaria socialis TaxID=392032 RepID=A0A817PPA0_9BILA|nr:unnamed protein product [Rotaria socialis]CAF3212706.1 unnamed protein product [Rotaria socialis]CAF3333776.1 unnamed protein product [Rotaria socialis]CAF4444270.1 unnamed protein product [Rotaria socialis]CAF4526948.1 unnamed protein product [Rotaria socialis]